MEAAQLIEEYKDTIVSNWISEVKKELPEAKKHGKSALENDVPLLLEKIAHLLQHKNEDLDHESIEHGKLRAWFDNYSLMHVIREYRILKRVLFRFLDLKGQVKVNERNVIMYAIDESIEQAGEVFFKMRTKMESDAREIAEVDASKLRTEDHLRTEFIEGLSHDMKNPITNIKLALDLLNDSTGVKSEEMLNIVKKNVARTEILLNTLMKVNLVNSDGRLPISIEKCDLSNEIYSFRNDIKVNKDTEVFLDLPDKPIIGYWDMQAILRALDNLVQNAIRYGDIERPITIGSRQQNDFTYVFVHNYGAAIPFEEKARIFSRLYQINKNSGVGQGLGLAVVKEVVEAHGGKVDISSSFNEGTTFTITLPNDSSKFQRK